MPKKKTTPETSPEIMAEDASMLEMTENSTLIDHLQESQTTDGAQADGSEAEIVKPVVKIARGRGKRYAAARSQVDKTKAYPVVQAIETVKRTSVARFGGSVEAHGITREVGVSATLTFPHSTGKSVRVAIVSEEVLDQIAKGNIEFDILLAKPEDMKTIAKYAKVLGPKGLMPNPKNGTVTPNPEKKKKDLEAGSITIKTERKAPLFHAVVGKTKMTEVELAENVQALMDAFGTKLIKLSLCSTMGPSVRVQLDK